MKDQIAAAPSLDTAGAALKALGEEVVLLAFYRGGGDFPEDRYSVRLSLEGVGSGIQESAPSPSAAFAKAVATRGQRRTSLAAEAALRGEVARRLKGGA
ncbi:hypothetical protein E2493_05975 [Sphingomonas parva]|uniref:Uncharacterized protein n=1 Tax=Sphingomonas parva TaxID=2555898 RepID=A0A4Y8ZSU0_9SPHN|nr:hypothetical protein [Sphingomonas parva]TFI59071.1 hypothetical protein E2493_05975 [Sphingomonas parva]